MKKNKYSILIPAGLLTVTVIAACNKFLDKTPVGTLSPSTLYNKTGIDGLLIGAYPLLDGEGGNNSGWGSAASNWVYGSVCADEAYKGSTPSDQGDIFPLEIWTATPTNPYPASKWALCYDGVQRANEVIRALGQSTGIADADITEITAEARFLRGHYHFELKKVFGNVPYIGETVVATTTPEEVSNVDGSGNYVNIWPQIEADFQFAVDNLPETQEQVGRVNKWAAMAFLAKVYMFEAKYTEAKQLLDQIITNGKTSGGTPYDLVANYFDNFNAATQNNAETVFAAQMSVNDGSATAQNNGQGVANGNYGDALNFPYNNGPGACCGFFNPSQTLANAYKTDGSGLPMFDTYNNGSAVSAHSNPYTGTLDPRIDMVMGRPGIPYLDWGVIPADDSWVRNDQGSNGRFVPKKNVYSKSQQGSLSSTENYWAAVQLTANDVNLIRFADVLLWAAECEAQVGDLTKALGYVNRVRNRASNTSSWIKNAAGTGYADNYLIKPYTSFANKDYALKAIMFERRLELALEGHRFFDLVRWGTAIQELNAYAAYEKQIKNSYAFLETRTFTEKSEYFAIPQGQIDALNANGTVNLKQNPGY
jgi:hypothetical protein